MTLSVSTYARIIKIFFLFVYVPIVICASLFQWGYAYLYIPYCMYPSIDFYHCIQLMLAGLVDGISIVLIMYITYYLAKLLDQYQKNNIFSPAVLAVYNKITYIALAWTIYNPIKSILLSIITTMYNPIGKRILSFTFTSSDMYHIVIVGFLVILGSIMQEAYKLKQDNDLTI
jgi:hypothetical protein